MNNDFFECTDYYLIDTFNGETKKSRIKFDVIHNSKYNLTNTKEVAIESKTKEIDRETGEEYYTDAIYQAFMKSSKDTYKDDLDVINSEIAELLDVDCSKVYKVETSTNLFGIVNIVEKENYEEQLSVDILINKLLRMIKEKNISLTSWLKDYFSLPKTDNNLLLNNEKDIVSVIEMSIFTIMTLFNLDNQELECLRRDYIKMIFFDLLSNNTIRNFNTYSILLSKDVKYSKLAPIYDYNNDIDSKSYYVLNNQYLDKSAVISTLYHRYYPYIKKLSKGLKDNKGLYLESINLIIENNINQIYANTIKDNYKNNIETIISLENIHSKNYMENKLDIAMTQTSINLNALNKSQLIHTKYSKRNKNDEVKVENVEEVKIKVEEKKKESSFSNILIILLAIILVIGIIVGVVYIILNIKY